MSSLAESASPGRPARGVSSAVRGGFWPALLVGLLLASLSSGCRYGTGGDLPRHLRTVSVDVFRNRTRERGLESEVTTAVVTSLAAAGRLEVVGAGAADAELTGEITAFRREILAEDRFGDAVEVVLVIEARITLFDRKQEKPLLEDAPVSSRLTSLDAGLYDLRRGIPESEGRRQAIAALGRNVARKVLDLW